MLGLMSEIAPRNVPPLQNCVHYYEPYGTKCHSTEGKTKGTTGGCPHPTNFTSKLRPHLLAKLLFEFAQFGCNDKLAIRLGCVVVIIELVIVLGGIELRRGFQPGDDGFRKRLGDIQ